MTTAVLGTIAVHVALGATLIVVRPRVPLIARHPAHEVELEPPPPPVPAPPVPLPVPLPLPDPDPSPPPPTPSRSAPAPAHAAHAAHAAASAAAPGPATATDPAIPSGPAVDTATTGPTIKIADLGAGTTAVAHKVGGSGTGSGQAGTGTGTGTGTGSAPMSIASIKTRAKPKSGFDFLDIGKDYPAEAKRLGIEGQLKVRLLVDATGKVTRATLLDHLGHGLDELALSRARDITFEPALDSDDHAVASIVVWTFTFTLPS